MEFQQQSLEIAKEIGQRDVEANAYCGLGDVYRSLDLYSEARDCYQQSLDIAREINYCRGEADASFNLGLALAKLDLPSEAVVAFQNARQLYQEMGLETKVQDCDSQI
jgi:tetratricopeptide (TPR) repeat protein